ncbi:MAG: hypothetical protein GY929_00615 [Actinomycetia bacterium]|nr:hypothetical protein [Actinomycetes bacterium]
MTKSSFIDGLVATFLLIVGVVGTIEAFRRNEDGLAVLFVLMLLVSMGGVVSRRSRGRKPVLVRSDLFRWLEVTSGATGESTSDLADRCISISRADTQG